jgi:hypothetical protein
MGCNCKMMEIIVAIAILVATIWPNLLGANISWWVVVIAAAVLLLHALKCGCAGMCADGAKVSGKKKKKR